MIAQEVEYHRPGTLAEATEAHRALRAAGRRPVYYGGGTEVVTRARLGERDMDALIDLKAIPELRVCETRDGELRLGAALRLAEICERNPWPLLSAACGRVADHTSRCQITLGGNIAGRIAYREAVLPLLLADARVLLASAEQSRIAPLREVFSGSLRLRPGELLAQILVDQDETARPHVCTKRTRFDWVDYPLVTLALVDHPGGLRLAASGLVASGPIRSAAMEAALSDRGGGPEAAAARVADAIPEAVVDDIHGSRDYRRFVFERALGEALAALGR